MRKKYLSALLFGALLVTSTGTFTSCKDYDDDINGLQEQITANADAIKALQDKIGDGKFVTNIASESNGLKITWNDGSSTVIENVINGEDQKGDVVSIDPETGEIKINNEGTGFYASKGEGETPEEVKLPYVNEEGVLVIFDENGEEVVTGIRVSPVTAVINEDASAVLTIIAADGTKQTINIPSAASAILSINFSSTKVNTPEGILDEAGSAISQISDQTIYLAQQIFTFTGNDYISNINEWKGEKKLPNNGDCIISSPSTMDIRLNPVSVDATNVKFYLTDTKNVDLSPVVFNATPESAEDAIDLDNINSRSNKGNGLWTLSMETVCVEKDAYGDEDAGIAKNIDAAVGKAYALNAEHACRSEYGVTIAEIKGEALSNFTLKQAGTTIGSGTVAFNSSNNNIHSLVSGTKVKVGKPVSVTVDKPAALYDLYLTADASDIEVYGLTFNQADGTFTVGKNPDISSVSANFDIEVWAVENSGKVYKEVVRVGIDAEIVNDAQYETIEHNISATDNLFGIDLSVMKEALGDNLNTWLQNVNLGNTEYKLYSDKECKTEVSNSGLTFEIVKELASEQATTNRNEANFVRVTVDNTTGGSNAALDLNETYYIKVDFKTGGVSPSVLNSIVVPVKFTAPTLAEQFTKETAVFTNSGNTAYAYLNVADQISGSANTGYAAYSLKNAFSKLPSVGTVTLTLAADDEVTEDYDSEDLAKIGSSFSGAKNTVDLSATTKIYLNKDVKDDSGMPYGYKKELTIIASSTKYQDTRWKYTGEDGKYTFKMVIMSPIFEGVVAAVNSAIEIPATDKSYKLGNTDIKATTYNNIEYKVLPDLVDDNTDEGVSATAVWSRTEIASVKAVSKNINIFVVDELPVNASLDADGKVVEGYFNVRPQNISITSDAVMSVTVTDIWGFAKTSDVNVKVLVNKNN